MANIVEIENLDAPELAPYARLTEAQLRDRQRAGAGLFIAESAKVIDIALSAGYEAVSMLMERGQVAGAGRALVERCPEVPVYVAPREALARLTGYALTRGMLCAMRRRPEADAAQICAGARRVAVLENIADPANVGAIFRSAAALGAQALLLSPGCCDPLYRRALRASMGAVFQIPWARIEGWPEAGAARLRGWGFRLAALSPGARAMDLDDARLTREARLAILLGAEGDGLAPGTLALADCCVRIPMCGGVDSLNVAAAAAVAFWQLCRPPQG